MHGGQGSQNGFDNSGKRGEIHFQDGENSDRAVKVLSQMSALLKSWVDEGAIKVKNFCFFQDLDYQIVPYDMCKPHYDNLFRYKQTVLLQTPFPK